MWLPDLWKFVTGVKVPQPQKPAPIQPMVPETPGRKRLAGIVGASAVAGLIAVVAQWEGKPGLEPHWDRIGKVWDVCYGDTIAEKRSYTEEECRELLAYRLAEFAEPVLARNPELRGRDPQLIAATSLAYNIGSAAYNRSTVARRFSAGDFKGACDAFLMWTKAGGREVKGLRNRRESERQICLRGL